MLIMVLALASCSDYAVVVQQPESCVAETEVCDFADNDCDGIVDEEVASAPTWYGDMDADGYGSDNFAAVSCTQPYGFVADNTDCDDEDDRTYPSASERCDGTDNDCNGLSEYEDPDVELVSYADMDADGYGSVHTTWCQSDGSIPVDYAVREPGDCDDNDPTVNPAAGNCDGED